MPYEEIVIELMPITVHVTRDGYFVIDQDELPTIEA